MQFKAISSPVQTCKLTFTILLCRDGLRENFGYVFGAIFYVYIAGEVFVYFIFSLVFFFFGSFCFWLYGDLPKVRYQVHLLLVLEGGAMPSSKMVLSVSLLSCLFFCFCFWPVVCITPLATESIRGFFALVFLSFSSTVISVVGHHIWICILYQAAE